MHLHIQEIKNRILLLVINFLFMFSVTYFYKDILVYLVVDLHYFNIKYFVFTNVIELFNSYFTVIIFILYQSFLLYLFYSLIVFFCYSLFYSEYYFFLFFYFLNIIVWFIIMMANYCLIVPCLWFFFKQFAELSVIDFYFEFSLKECLNFVINLYYSAFFFHVFIVFGSTFVFLHDVLNEINIKKFRKCIYFIVTFASALLTPPDFFNFMFLNVLLLVMLEALFFLSCIKISFN